jgi:hypothetical protein
MTQAKLLTPVLVLFSTIIVSGCSMFGQSSVEVAPYSVLEKEEQFELRHYDRLVLVTTALPDGPDSQNSPFYKLFNYISGKNEGTKEIPMTAPVFIDQPDSPATSTEFKESGRAMSFVLPENFTLETAPLPQDPAVTLEELNNYTAATITFSGFLKQPNIDRHKALLEDWIRRKGFEKIGGVKAAGYNPPSTVPALRRNEILIQVKKP